MPYTVHLGKGTAMVAGSGTDIANAFTQSALGIIELTHDVDRLKSESAIEITVHAPNTSMLFSSWISALLDLSKQQKAVITDVSIHAIVPANKKESLLTARVHMASTKIAKEHATHTIIRSIRKGAMCARIKGTWQCSITVNTTA